MSLLLLFGGAGGPPVAVTATCGLGLDSSGTAQKVSPADATSTIAVTSDGAATKTALVGATSTVGATSSGVVAKTSTVGGASTVAAASSGVAVKAALTGGVAIVDLASTSTATRRALPAGTTEVGLSSTGTAAKHAIGAATAAFGLASAGTSVEQHAASGTTFLGLAGTASRTVVPPVVVDTWPLDIAVAAILACVHAALVETDAGGPARACTVAGALAWDACDCGLLAVTVDKLFHSRAFPRPDVDVSNPCPPPYLAANLTITVLRCAPSPDAAGNPPTCAQLDAAALTWLVDSDTVRAALFCCLVDLAEAGTIEEYTLGDQTPTGPEGGCVGWNTHLTLGLANCVACPVPA